MKKWALFILPTAMLLTGCEDFDASCQIFIENSEGIPDFFCDMLKVQLGL